ncbi:MAG: MFS transporter [Syntrophobacterales bacterium]
MATVCLGAFMATMDTSLVSVGLPQIASFLKTSVAAISWVMVAYLLANASLQMVVGRLADLAAPGRLFFAGVTVFAAGSGLGGLSPNFPILITCRVVQGMGAALMLGVAPKLISLAFPEGERGFALGVFSAGFATGATIGAPLGGLLLTFLSWRALFFVNPLLGLVAVTLGSRTLRVFRTPQAWKWRTIDPWGAVILTSTLALFILTLAGIRDHGWADTRNYLGLALVVGGLVFLIYIEQRQPNPLLHQELWLSRSFLLGAFGVLLAFACVMGSFFLLPFFLVQVYSYPPAHVGLMLAVLALSNVLMSLLGGYLADRVHPQSGPAPGPHRHGVGPIFRAQSERDPAGRTHKPHGPGGQHHRRVKELRGTVGGYYPGGGSRLGLQRTGIFKIRRTLRDGLLSTGLLAGRRPGSLQLPGQPPAQEDN